MEKWVADETTARERVTRRIFPAKRPIAGFPVFTGERELSDYPTTRRRSGERGRNVTRARNALSISRFRLARVEKTDTTVARDLYSLELVLPETMRSISLLVLCKRQAVLSLDRSDTAALVTNIEMQATRRIGGHAYEKKTRGTDSRSLSVARA